MNTKQLIDISEETDCFWVWKYQNGQYVWMTIDKSTQLDNQRNHESYADMYHFKHNR